MGGGCPQGMPERVAVSVEFGSCPTCRLDY